MTHHVKFKHHPRILLIQQYLLVDLILGYFGGCDDSVGRTLSARPYASSRSVVSRFSACKGLL
jgi:hypothetical protein